MKNNLTASLAALTLFAALAVPMRVAAQEQQQQTAQKLPHYTVTDLGTLGGTFGQAFGINNKGEVVGWSTLPGDTVAHAFLWRKGQMTDLGAIGGTVSAAYSINERSEVVGISETSAPDPLGEDFCGFDDHLICLPFVWQGGVMTALPTLGGNNGAAIHINDRGRVFGFAENATPDSTCVPPAVLHFEPVIWNNAKVKELPIFPGDVDGVAGGFNNAGQATIPTGNCAFLGPPSGHDSFYQHGTLTDFGSFGGNPIAANNMNNRGQVVGGTVGPGNANVEAVLWQNGVASGLGFLPGAVESVGNAINDEGQVVGQSCDAAGNCRGFLWQNGLITDLNALVPAGTDYTFPNPAGINSRGEIVGLAVQNSTGGLHAFLLTPCREGDAACASSAPTARARTAAAPANPVLSGRGVLERFRVRRFPGRSNLGPASGPTN